MIVIDGLALVVIVVGTVETFVGGLRAMLGSPSGHERRDIWLRYARWLVAGLTFQLAADIIETSITIKLGGGGADRSRRADPHLPQLLSRPRSRGRAPTATRARRPVGTVFREIATLNRRSLPVVDLKQDWNMIFPSEK